MALPEGVISYLNENAAKEGVLNNADIYHEFIRANDAWRDFHRWIKRPEFPYEILNTLREHHIKLGVNQPPASLRGRTRLFLEGLTTKPGVAPTLAPRLRTRFEFSMLPADGGSIRPHTDQPQKIVTLVVAMPLRSEWNSAYGGGTEVMKPKDISRNYNFMNNQMKFDEVEPLRTFEYQPNQCVVIKTFNSLHGVRPMQGHGTNLMRKSRFRKLTGMGCPSQRSFAFPAKLCGSTPISTTQRWKIFTRVSTNACMVERWT